MKKEYLIKGLDCANCAAKIESTLQKTSGVVSASLIFIKSVLRIEWVEGYQGDTLEKVKSVVRRIEPSATVTGEAEQGISGAGSVSAKGGAG